MGIRITETERETPATKRKAALRNYVKARELADRATEAVKKAEVAVMEVLDEEELKSGSVTDDNVTYTISLAQPRTTVSYNEETLKKALGAKLFSKVTTSKLDKTKLEEAVSSGEIDVHVVAQHTTISHGARSVRLTRKVAEPSDSATA